MSARLLACVAALICVAPAQGVEVGGTGFLVRHELTIAAPPAKVYEVLVGQIGSWWDPAHTYSGEARNLSIDARAGGCFCERLPNGGVEHMRVVQLRSNEMLRMVGGLGPLQGSGVSGAMTWRLSPAENVTKVELIYSVGGFVPGGFDKIAGAVQRVLGEQIGRLKRFIETGTAGAPP